MLPATASLKVGRDYGAGVGRVVGQLGGAAIGTVGGGQVDVPAANVAEGVHSLTIHGESPADRRAGSVSDRSWGGPRAAAGYSGRLRSRLAFICSDSSPSEPFHE